MQNRYLLPILAIVAVAASPVDAETVIYGRLQTSQSYFNPHADEGSRYRFGLQDSEESGSELKNLFEMEWQVDTGQLLGGRNQRLESDPGYLERNWGMTTVGLQETPHYDNTIVDLSIDYRRGPLTIGTSFLNYRKEDLEYRELWGAATRYRFSDFALTAQYEYDGEQDFETSHEWAFMGEYYLGNNTLRARYSDRDRDGSTDPQWTLGLNHQFNKRTSFFAEFQDNDTAAEQLYGAGLRLDF